MLLLGLFSCTNSDDTDHASVTIKAIENADNAGLSGGMYRIVNDNVTIGDYTVVDGKATVISLPLGSYVVEEIAAPFGYASTGKQFAFEVTQSATKEVTFSYDRDTNLPTRMNVSFSDKSRRLRLGDYTAVRIGEYYWVNSNFTHSVPWGVDFENAFPMTQPVLDKYLERARLDKSQFQIGNIKDFESAYGRYYSRPSLIYMYENGEIHETETDATLPGWKFPSAEDYRQLFAMVPFNTSFSAKHTSLNQFDVRFALAPRIGENKMAFEINDPNGGPYRTYWFDSNYVTDIYDFNLMPGGLRLNGPSSICNGYGPAGGCYTDGQKGDIYGLFYVASLAVRNADGTYGGAGMHDYLDTRGTETYHLMNVRWCKPLSDKELGYKLYINSAQTDIKKLGLKDPVPSGFSELPRGYIRGFYVHYILDNPNPSVTVADVVQYAKTVDDAVNYGW